MLSQSGLAALVQNNDWDEITAKIVKEILTMNEMKKFPEIAPGTWSWGVGAAGSDQVFGNHLGKADLKAVFDLEFVSRLKSVRSSVWK